MGLIDSKHDLGNKSMLKNIEKTLKEATGVSTEDINESLISPRLTKLSYNISKPSSAERVCRVIKRGLLHQRTDSLNHTSLDSSLFNTTGTKYRTTQGGQTVSTYLSKSNLHSSHTIEGPNGKTVTRPSRPNTAAHRIYGSSKSKRQDCSNDSSDGGLM